MKKVALFILALAISISAFAAKYPVVKPEGEGTQESPYLFTQIENFGWIADQKDKIDAGTTVYCVQINDIDATETKYWDLFPCIDTYNFYGENKGPWTLNYDGQGFNIENLYIYYNGGGSYTALFRSGNLQLKNINIVSADSRVLPGMCSAILVGSINSGYIDNCHISDTKINSAAGLVYEVYTGKEDTVQINNCSVDAELINSWAGLICFVENYGTLVIQNTSVKGQINTNEEGFLVSAGFVYQFLLEKNSKTIIEDCYTDVDISCETNKYPGLSGLSGFICSICNQDYKEQVDITINRCYSAGKINNVKPWQSASFLSHVNDCEPAINDCYYNATTLKKEDKYALPKTEDEMKQQATFENWDFEKVWAIDEGNGFPYLRSEIPEEYPELNVNYKGQGECTVDNGVVTVTGGSEKDTLTVFSENGKCRVRRIVADNGLKKIKVAGDLEGLQVAGKVGSLLVNGGDLGKEGKDFALIFDADQATIKVKAAKAKTKIGSKAGEQVVGGNVKGNILCGTRNESGKITTLGTVKKLVTLGGNIENGKLVAGKVNQVSAKPKAGKGGQIIDFKTETN